MQEKCNRKFPLVFQWKKSKHMNKTTSKFFSKIWKSHQQLSLFYVQLVLEMQQTEKQNKTRSNYTTYMNLIPGTKFHPFCWQGSGKDKYWIFTFYFCH